MLKYWKRGDKIRQVKTDIAGESYWGKKSISWNKEGHDSMMKGNSKESDHNAESVCSEQNRLLTYKVNLMTLS